jgi:hypothetical protein
MCGWRALGWMEYDMSDGVLFTLDAMANKEDKMMLVSSTRMV